MRLAVGVALTLVVTSLVAYIVVRGEPGQVSGSLTEVSRDVTSEPHRVGAFVLTLKNGRDGTLPATP